MAAALEPGAASDAGRVRPVNEDCYLSVQDGEWDGLFAVADGLGGYNAGDTASRHAVSLLPSALASAGGELVLRLKHALEAVNASLCSLAASDPSLAGMGTTLTVALVTGQFLYFAHVGDSRGYLIRRGRISQFTHDHSWVAERVRAGVMAPEEAAHHPHKNVVTRAMGAAPGIDVDLGHQRLEQGDIILLCSDGLSNLVGDHELARIASTTRSPQAACAQLVALANRRGGFDNITAVMVKCHRLLPRPETAPAQTRRTMRLTPLPPDTLEFDSAETQPRRSPLPPRPSTRRPWAAWLVVIALSAAALAAALRAVLG